MQEMTLTSWSDFKTLVTNKTLLMQYSVGSNSYEVFAPEAGVFMWHITLISGTADYTDFENNFKSAANAPMMINGVPVEAPNVSETALFNAESIRDTNAHNSTSSLNTGYRVKTILVNNSLNQAVSFQCQGSRDNTNWINIGQAWEVAATTWAYQSCDTYFPYMRAVATCSVAPTTGTLSMWLEKVGV